MSTQTLRLFEAFGIELEYMVVDRHTLRPRPIAESILVDENGQATIDEAGVLALRPVDGDYALHLVLERALRTPGR